MKNQTKKSNKKILSKIDQVLSHPSGAKLIRDRQVSLRCIQAIDALNDFYLPMETHGIIDFVYMEFVKTLSTGIYYEAKELTACIAHIKSIVLAYTDILNAPSTDTKHDIAYDMIFAMLIDSPDLNQNIEQIDHMFGTYIDNIPRGTSPNSDVTLIVRYMKTFLKDIKHISTDMMSD